MHVLKRLAAVGAMVISTLSWAEPGVTDSSITIGMSSPFSGPNGAYGIDMRQTIEAYFNQVNKVGGINGRKLTLVALDDGPIQSIADLRGRRIGYSVGGFEDALLRQMLGAHGVGLDEVTLINVNFALSQALLSGQVDAVIGAFRNFELNQLDIEGRPGHAFYPEEEGVPTYDELIFIASKERLDDPRLPRFMAAVEQARLYREIAARGAAEAQSESSRA